MGAEGEGANDGIHLISEFYRVLVLSNSKTTLTMSSSSNRISSSISGCSSNMKPLVGERTRGIPNNCWCGEASVMRTSKTADNPGRLFLCCPNGSEKMRNHLFKWVDVSVVEEIEEIKGMISGVKEEIENLELESKTCEAIVGSYEKDFKKLSNLVVGYEKELKECVGELQSLKNMIFCGFGMIVLYYFLLT